MVQRLVGRLSTSETETLLTFKSTNRSGWGLGTSGISHETTHAMEVDEPETKAGIPEPAA
jgi:hypothetical protein